MKNTTLVILQPFDNHQKIITKDDNENILEESSVQKDEINNKLFYLIETFDINTIYFIGTPAAYIKKIKEDYEKCEKSVYGKKITNIQLVTY